MFQEFYKGSSLLGYPLFALLFFVAAFCFAVAGTFRRKRTLHIESLSRLPLDDDHEQLTAGGNIHV